MSTTFAFAGFRHGHLLALLAEVQNRDDLHIVAAAESNTTAREAAVSEQGVTFTHDDPPAMIAETDAEVVVLGDTYGRRGATAIAALKQGKHVIADKPLCASLDELDAIEAAAKAGDRCVGCMLDQRDGAPFITARRLIAEGAIGEVHTVTFLGQHPLMWGTRPDWYFEPGQHGGTINDIAIHAMDTIPWMTGRAWSSVAAARAWNARLPEVPHFQDGGQLMLELDNAGGVLGDVSYLAPDRAGYNMNTYWRYTIHGSAGMIETCAADAAVTLVTSADEKPQQIDLDPPRPAGYLDDFLNEIAGQPRDGGLTTAGVLSATRWALQAQAAAD